MPEQLLPSSAEATTRPACRVYERHSCSVSSSCKPTSGWRGGEANWPAIIRDVSQGGIRVVLPRRFEPGAGLEIELPGATPDESYSVIVRVLSVSRDTDGGWSLGCKFLSHLSEEEVGRLVPCAFTPAAEPVAPSRTAPPPQPQAPAADGHRHTLCGVHIRLESAAGTVLDCPIRHLNVPGNWPPPAGKVMSFFALTDAGTLPATRVEVIDCTPQSTGWLLRCRLLGAPAAQTAARQKPTP
jgi:hypothetical protein